MKQPLPDIVSRSRERQLNMGILSSRSAVSRHAGMDRQQEFCMYFGSDRIRHPAQPIAKQNVPDAAGFTHKGFPVLILSQGTGDRHIKTLFLTKNLKKERGKQI